MAALPTLRSPNQFLDFQTPLSQQSRRGSKDRTTHSSSGLGHRTFNPRTRVRIPRGLSERDSNIGALAKNSGLRGNKHDKGRPEGCQWRRKGNDPGFCGTSVRPALEPAGSISCCLRTSDFSSGGRTTIYVGSGATEMREITSAVCPACSPDLIRIRSLKRKVTPGIPSGVIQRLSNSYCVIWSMLTSLQKDALGRQHPFVKLNVLRNDFIGAVTTDR